MPASFTDPLYGARENPEYLEPCADCGLHSSDHRREHGTAKRCGRCNDRFFQESLTRQGR